VVDLAAQPHRVGAVAGGRDLLGPPRIAVPGPVHDFGEDAGEQLAHPNRVDHVGLPCVWPATDLGMDLGMVAVKLGIVEKR
jgi:hypothetical protein